MGDASVIHILMDVLAVTQDSYMARRSRERHCNKAHKKAAQECDAPRTV
jgi:hypothetical protein